VTARRAVAAVLLGAACLLASCGGDDPAELRGQTITVWSGEWQPDRLRATQGILRDFTAKTGIRTRLVPIGDDELPPRIAAARQARRLPDVVLAVNAAASLAYAKEKVFDPDAADEVVDRLGRDTFVTRALDLVSEDDKPTGVPSDGWGQMLIYRRDLFDAAGLPRPATVEDIRAAAAKLQTPRRRGIALPTGVSGFTAETFEHVALAFGCQLVDDRGHVAFTSSACVDALAWYADMARNYAPRGDQDVDTTRESYFAGKAAMLFWSPFLLDGMAGLNADLRPTCPQCRENRAFLAENSGLVGPLAGPDGRPSQFGSVSTFNITTTAKTAAAKRLVEYLLSDGYVRWLGLSPQGKYPVRLGDGNDPTRYVTAWEGLESGTDTKAPLSAYYSDESIASLGDGVQSFQRWGFAQGQGALVGALGEEQPVARAVTAVIGGQDPGAAAAEAQRRIVAIEARLGDADTG